jgi:hypothetical protein
MSKVLIKINGIETDLKDISSPIIEYIINLIDGGVHNFENIKLLNDELKRRKYKMNKNVLNVSHFYSHIKTIEIFFREGVIILGARGGAGGTGSGGGTSDCEESKFRIFINYLKRKFGGK